jgi:hypothetical protein
MTIKQVADTRKIPSKLEWSVQVDSAINGPSSPQEVQAEKHTDNQFRVVVPQGF